MIQRLLLFSICLMSLGAASAQIITESQPGSEFAHYATNDLQWVLGGFADEYDGRAAEGGRDLFLQNRQSGNIDIWSGPGVEQFLRVKNADGQNPLWLIRYFGSLETSEGFTVKSNTGNAYVIASIAREDPFLFNLELGLGQVQCSEQIQDSLFVLVKSQGSITINDSLVRESSSEELVLLHMERNGTFSAEGILNSSGDYKILDIQKTESGLFMAGNFLGPVQIGQENIVTQTDFFDGLFLEWDLTRRELNNFVIASGVFDVRLTHLMLANKDTLLLGEYSGNVMLEDESLEALRLNNSMFLYSYRNKAIVNIGGQRDEQSINMHALDDGGILITGNYQGRFEFGALESDCRGDACGFFLQLDDQLVQTGFQNFFSSERTDIFNSYFFEEGLFCGSFEGEYRASDPIALDEDWFCERIALSTSIEEPVKDIKMNVYPNPVGSESIRIDTPWPGSHYQLFNAQGILRGRGVWPGQLQVYGLQRGLYFLRLYKENASKMLTFKKVN